MYRIVKDGTSLGMTEAPTYVRQAGNGVSQRFFCKKNWVALLTCGG